MIGEQGASQLSDWLRPKRLLAILALMALGLLVLVAFRGTPLAPVGPFEPPTQTELSAPVPLAAPPGYAITATDTYEVEALIVSRVGNDLLGREILDRLSRFGLRTDGIGVTPLAPTGTVSVSLDPQGKPTFTIHENVAWDLLEAGPRILDAAARAQAVCFGSLAQRRSILPTSSRQAPSVGAPTGGRGTRLFLPTRCGR